MIVYEIVGTEQDPTYQRLEVENGNRQYDLIRSLVTAALALNRPMLSLEIIKALNYHAISCLHVSAGQFRPTQVHVGNHQPVDFWQVPSRMDLIASRATLRVLETSVVARPGDDGPRLARGAVFVSGFTYQGPRGIALLPSGRRGIRRAIGDSMGWSEIAVENRV